MGFSLNTLYITVSTFFQRGFEKLGIKIGQYAKFLIPACILITSGLACGIAAISSESSAEVLYTPIHSRARHDKAKYQGTFPEQTGSYFVRYALTEDELFGTLIVQALDGNIFSNASLSETRRHISAVKSLNVSYHGELITFSDLCARRDGRCYVEGGLLMDDDFIDYILLGTDAYPPWYRQEFLLYLSDVNITDGKITSASYFKVTFFLRHDSEEARFRANAWAAEFLKMVPMLTKSQTTVNYTTFLSLDEEINKNTSGDIAFFMGTFILMTLYVTVVAAGDAVSSRTWALWAGVMAAVFGIVSSLGLVGLCGVKFVNIVAVMPFLVIGIGVDDMFLLTSTWTKSYSDADESVPARMGRTFQCAGIGITITSLTDLLAFVIGASSEFVCVRNFSIYTGVAIIFCYIYQCLFFGSCLALHGYRVNDIRHCVTCKKTKSRKELREEGKSTCTILCCGGSTPKKNNHDESLIEYTLRKYLPKMLLNVYGTSIVIFVFLGYIAISVWGVVNLKQGIELKDLASQDSYFYNYVDIFESKFSFLCPIPFVFSSTNYSNPEESREFESLFDVAKLDPDVNNNSLICWYHMYKLTPFYDNSSNENFIQGLKIFFDFAQMFKNDVIFDASNSSIQASRCYLFSEDIKDTYLHADLMLRMRTIADTSPLSVYVFHPVYIFFDQFNTVLPNTMKSVSMVLVVVAIITFIFLPHPLLIFLVVLNILSILVGVFGFLHIWGLTISAVTMIDLIMSVGFSVDFSVHVCSAYMVGVGRTRREKVQTAIAHAASPILNGGMSSFLGIIVLAFSGSYIASSFFKVMFSVILFGMLHSVFLLPVVLFLCGPLPRSVIKPHSETLSNTLNNTISTIQIADGTGGIKLLSMNPLYIKTRDSFHCKGNVVTENGVYTIPENRVCTQSKKRHGIISENRVCTNSENEVYIISENHVSSNSENGDCAKLENQASTKSENSFCTEGKKNTARNIQSCDAANREPNSPTHKLVGSTEDNATQLVELNASRLPPVIK